VPVLAQFERFGKSVRPATSLVTSTISSITA
jgi:hypothetical protein